MDKSEIGNCAIIGGTILAMWIVTKHACNAINIIAENDAANNTNNCVIDMQNVVIDAQDKIIKSKNKQIKELSKKSSK